MIEYTDVEMAEPEDVDHEHGHEPQAPRPQGHPSAHDVILGALGQRLPCPSCGSLDPCRCAPVDGYSPTEARATLIEQGLALYGYLPSPDDERAPFDPEEAAQWLADRSGFPRYTQVENGWRRILEAEADVELAAIKAQKRVPTDEVEMVKAAKAALLAWHQSKAV